MKATKIYYEELRTGYNYSNRKVGIELQVEEGEKAERVAYLARSFVQAVLASNDTSPAGYQKALELIQDAKANLDRLAEAARQALPLEDEVPF